VVVINHVHVVDEILTRDRPWWSCFLLCLLAF